MHWASESRSKRNVRSGDAVSMPQCAIDLRKIKSCELGNQPYFRTPYKTQVSQEAATTPGAPSDAAGVLAPFCICLEGKCLSI